jgi:chromosome segregation ATPase
MEREYDQIQSEIADLFVERKEAEHHGVLDAVDAKLATLKMRRDELQESIQQLHDESNDWIDHIIECFKLAKLAQEAIQYGSPEIRQAILNALSSNYFVKDGKLVCRPKSRCRERQGEAVCTIWGERWDSNP